MLTIRFARVGRKNRAQFRIVLQEHTIAPGGRHIAVLGSYDPHQKKAVLKADKIKEWISKGAQVSDSAYNLFVREGVVEGKKRAIKMEKPKTKPASNASHSDAGGEAPIEEAKVEEIKTEAPAAEIKEPAHNASHNDAGGEVKPEEVATEIKEPAHNASPASNDVATSGRPSDAGGEAKE